MKDAPVLLSRRAFLRNSAVLAGLAGVPALLDACGGGAGTPGALAQASRFEIHPTLGIARVGNSVDAFYFGTEVPGTLPRARSGFKDRSGAMAKQAARFRVYAFGPRGEPLGEVPASVRVDWTVSLANKKPAWYQYYAAMDLPIAQPVGRRNASVAGDERQGLIASVQRSIHGRGAGPVGLGGPVVFGQPVDFGELTTDGHGRLVVLPGSGEASSVPGAPIVSFSDNDGWVDNVCDGTVEALVHLGTRTVRATGAYLLVTPANFGPSLAAGPVTLLDQIRSPLTLAGMLPRRRVNFEEDLRPLFDRLLDLQWVNKGVFEATRSGQSMSWLSDDRQRLADPSPASRGLRRRVAALFRDPASASSPVGDLPPLIGDGGVTMPPSNDYSWLPLTPLQYEQLQEWAEGHFDVGAPPPSVSSVEDLPVGEQPGALDQAGLVSVLGGANHPGVEAPWVLRVPTMWTSAYRLRVIGQRPQLLDYGPMLTPEVATGPDGPVHGVSPGDLTMWMGVPWQADAASCRDGYRGFGWNPPGVSPYLPTYWPARVPNEVLSQADYEIVMDSSRPRSEREEAFARRRTWIRAVADIAVPTQQFSEFIATWSKFGVVVEKPGPADRGWPAVMKVEIGVEYPEPTPEDFSEYPCRTQPGITCPIDW